MQYSDSVIGTWPFCRVRLMDSSGSEHTRSALLLRHSLPQLLSSCQDGACLKAVGGAVARAGGHKERASNLWKLSAAREPRKASMCIRLLSSSCLSSAYPAHSPLAPGITLPHYSIHFHTSQPALLAC
jgi:hypothetical protein